MIDIKATTANALFFAKSLTQAQYDHIMNFIDDHTPDSMKG
jgi:hypothetical protein